MKPLADGVWTEAAPVTILGMPLTSTMTVLRLGSGGLLLHSPVEMTAGRRAAVEALGKVEHMYAPNTYHHLGLGRWTEAFPTARVHAPVGLVAKRSDIRIDRCTGGAPDPALASSIDEVPVDGFRLQECVLFHRRSATLVVADLVHNVGRPRNPWANFYTRAMGFHGRVAMSRMIRRIGFADRRAARRSVERILALPFERIVVGHGPPVTDSAREKLEAAMAWLPAAS